MNVFVYVVCVYDECFCMCVLYVVFQNVATYSCRRRTARWPMALFYNMLDVSAYNAFVVWREINPTWKETAPNFKRRYFLQELGRALVSPYVKSRQHVPRTPASLIYMRKMQNEDEAAGPSTAGPSTAGPSRAPLYRANPSTARPSREGPSTAVRSRAGPSMADPATTLPSRPDPFAAQPSGAGPSMADPSEAGASSTKRKRCQRCFPRDVKTSLVCKRCKNPVCKRHGILICDLCYNL